MRDFSRFLVSWLENRKGKSFEVSWKRCCLVHLDERNRMEHSVLRLEVIFPAKTKLAWQKLPFYVVTAELGTKNRLPGISKTIKKFEENRPPWPCHCRSEAKAQPFGANLVPFDREIFALSRKTKAQTALCRTLEFCFVYKTVKISRQN